MNSLPWPAPAKINLFLHITSQRADGYHELQTLFQFLSLQDNLFFETNDQGEITRHPEIEGINHDEDLIVRAATCLKKLSGITKGVKITLEKNLPMGGGIGGGSSDAATTLIALNELWELDLSTEQLAKVGLELGADVPVFIHGHASWAEGVGEKLQPFTPETPWFLLVHPGCHISTKEIFSSSQLTRDSTPIKMHAFVVGQGHNDCEPVVREMYPEVAKVIDWFGPENKARLTGTGACVFCPFEDESTAQRYANDLPEHWTGYVTKGLNRSPLLERLEKHRQHTTR